MDYLKHSHTAFQFIQVLNMAYEVRYFHFQELYKIDYRSYIEFHAYNSWIVNTEWN